MYIPKSKYKPAKYTNGDKFTQPDGTYYSGWYVETFRGEYLSGKVPSSSSKVLIDTTVSEEFTPKFKFTNDIIIHTEKNYSDGYFYRYFIQDKRNTKLIEVTVEKYNYFLKQNYTKEVQVKWILQGPAENINRGLYVYFGAAAKNKESIIEAEKTITGLSSIINSYSQFVK